VVGADVIASAYGLLGSPQAGSGTGRLALQTAVVASLRTEEAGRSARGRCYFPATGVVLTSSGAMSTTTTQNAADGFGTFLTQCVLSHSDPTAQIQVYSRVQDVLRPVSRVLVDGTPDTQRRRRDKLVSPYQTSSTYPD
jgi:hypothetical protein